MDRKKLLCFALASVLCVGSLSPVPVRAEETIESAKQKDQELKQEKAQAEQEKAALNQELNTILGDLEQAEADVAKKEQEIAKAEDELTAARIKENEQYEAMKIRIKYMYENGNEDMIAVLLSAEDMADFLNKAEYVEQVSVYDREMLVEFQNIVKEIEQKEARLKKEKEQLVQLQKTLASKQAEVESLIASKKSEISNLEDAIGENAALLNELIQKAKEAERRRKEAEQAAKEEAERRAAAQSSSSSSSSSSSGSSSSSSSSGSSSGGSYRPSSPVVSGSGRLSNPCPAARISSEYGPRRAPKPGASTYHRGRDYAAPSGTPIYASASGRVVTASYNSVRGNYVVIDHGNGLQTWYQHASRLYVSRGQTVSKGQNIAAVGMTGISTGPHLHFEVHVNGSTVDPRSYL